MSSLLAAPLFVVSLVVTLAAARAFAGRLDRLGVHFGLPEALIGLLTALAADGPEISSALVALIKGAHGVSVGVLVGSNVFNLAAMVGLSAVLAGCVRLPRDVLVLEGAVAMLITLIVGALLLAWLSSFVTLVLVACVLAPYLLLLIHGSPRWLRLGREGRDGLERAVERGPSAGAEGEISPPASLPRTDPARHLAAIIALDVPLIVAGSLGMVQAALTLGGRWGISNALLGVLVLGPLTSIPNAMTAVRLGLARRGSALVSEAFNSNTLNLVAGVTIPALFVTVTASSAVAKADVAWLVAMTGVCILLLARPGGVRRTGAAALIALYAAFVVVQFAAA
jgi:cation:H+ antiporter